MASEHCQICDFDLTPHVLRLNLLAADNSYAAVTGPICATCAPRISNNAATGAPDAVRWELVDLFTKNNVVVRFGDIDRSQVPRSTAIAPEDIP